MVCVLYVDSAGCSVGQPCSWDTEWKSRYCKLGGPSQLQCHIPPSLSLSPPPPSRRPKKASIQDAAVREGEGRVV